MNGKAARNRLVEHGQRLFDARKKPVRFTGEPPADRLLNDLKGHPHAFVLACVINRQIKTEKAWAVPWRIAEKLGGFSMETLAGLSPAKVKRLMSRPEPLHRFVEMMAGHFHFAVRRIIDVYAGDASRIWAGKPSSAEVIYRFLEFDGVGPKIASLAANTLAREFKIPLADYYSIDISADVHVRRVFDRLGLCAAEPTVEQVIFKARALCPEFPGIMDAPCWEIGRTWCRPKAPECPDCYMNDLCPSAAGGRAG